MTLELRAYMRLITASILMFVLTIFSLRASAQEAKEAKGSGLYFISTLR